MLPSQYHVWPPNTQRTNESTEEYLHGVWGPSSFTVNAHGMRGDSYDRNYRYRVLAVGGSTTIGAVLDDDEAWPHAVQDLIDSALGDGTAFVGNVGRPGHTVAQHVLQIEKLLEQYDDLDAVMVLAGVNDLIIHLNILRGLIKINLKSKPDPQKQLRNAFSVIPASPDGPWYLGSGIASWLSTRHFDAPLADGPIVDAAGV